jgi:hypothetical protein
MRRDTLLIVLTLAGSALWWWPQCMKPSLDLPWWLPLVCVALWTGLSTILSGGRWLRFVVASVVGTFAGLCSCVAIWPSTDGIANSYAPFAILVLTLAAAVVSLIAGLAARKVSAPNEKRAIWIALVSCFALGPIALALAPPLAAYRVKRNGRIAEERFESLKNAVEQTIATRGDLEHSCDGPALKQHYSGPAFSDDNWHRITGNYVRQDGYVFMIYCHEKNGYTIDAWPARGKVDGLRRFCTDESGRVSCGMEWNRSRHACVACPQ